MATSCHVDCVAAPPRYEPDSDISGVGVNPSLLRKELDFDLTLLGDH